YLAGAVAVEAVADREVVLPVVPHRRASRHPEEAVRRSPEDVPGRPQEERVEEARQQPDPEFLPPDHPATAPGPWPHLDLRPPRHDPPPLLQPAPTRCVVRRRL